MLFLDLVDYIRINLSTLANVIEKTYANTFPVADPRIPLAGTETVWRFKCQLGHFLEMNIKMKELGPFESAH